MKTYPSCALIQQSGNCIKVFTKANTNLRSAMKTYSSCALV